MDIQIARDHGAMSRQAAARIARDVRRRPDLLLGLATGATPTRTYAELAEMGAREPSLPMRHPATCETYLRENVLGPWEVARSRYHGFQSQPHDAAAECARLARWLARHGPLDLCVLGLGRNGHLLMNGPAVALRAGPHVARLAPSTRAHSMVKAMKTPPRRGRRSTNA